jgi:hypothetical protein
LGVARVLERGRELAWRPGAFHRAVRRAAERP